MGTNLVWVWLVLAVVGVLLIVFAAKNEDGSPAASVEWGYLALLGGVFGLLSDYMSFGAVMLIIVLVTGVIWALDKWLLARKRAPGERAPHYIDFPRGFFPIIAVVFLLRSFVAEPFQIPSSSMRPGLVVGDFILVNKFNYGLRVPVGNQVMLPMGKVQSGDVVVFNYPENERINFIKRVIGTPGDVVVYRDKQLSLNGKPVAHVAAGEVEYLEKGLAMIRAQQFTEQISGKSFHTLVEPDKPVYFPNGVRPFPGHENCEYRDDGFTCKVPQGQYFMMGDNRDNSEDSRYWGFVEDRLLVGKAFLIWMNFGDLSRIGTRIH
ncbi:signal peptidase I [Vogesella sp. LIG4]|uniref:signal peptidase I n=1 Tax=Vogesella sp. LIG4 TaxID=1192162 RepID=UPI00081FA1CD|nr:signal peptidase I [Vogesella sp. LIG4]SCK23298.1 signal peptidase I [Vogesella sp. LIG4]